jgi:hypothetical protein
VVAPLPGKRWGGTIKRLGPDLYHFGGVDRTGRYLDDLDVASLSGAIAGVCNWTKVPRQLRWPPARRGHTSGAWEDKMVMCSPTLRSWLILDLEGSLDRVP